MIAPRPDSLFPLYERYCPVTLEENLAWRRRVIEECRRPEAQRHFWQMCRADLLFYVNTFCWLFEPRTAKVLPFVTWDYQNDAFRRIRDSIQYGEDLVIEKSRDMGASWMCITTIEWLWKFQDMQMFLLLSRKEELVDKRGDPKSLFWKIDFLQEHQPAWMVPPVERMKLHLRNQNNGSVIDGESTNEFAGVADRRRAILADEFSKMDNQETIFRGTRDVSDCRIFLFTPEGAANTAYEIAHNDNFEKLTLHWTLHPHKQTGMYRWAKGEVLERMDDHELPADYPYVRDGKVRSPWYDKQCLRARHPNDIAQELDIDYLGSAYQFFDGRSIEQAKRVQALPPFLVGELEYDPLTAEPREFRPDPNGNLRLWCHLAPDGSVADDGRYAIGCDVASGTGASNSVAVVGDGRSGSQVAELAVAHLTPAEFAMYVSALSRWFVSLDNRPAYVIWEAPGPGREFGTTLLDLGSANVYYRRNEVSVRKKMSDVPGWWPTKDNRREIMAAYRDAIDEQSFLVRSAQQLDECLQIVYLPNRWIVHQRSHNTSDPSGASENHADRPTAGALCWKGMCDAGLARRPRSQPSMLSPPEGSLAWRRMQAEREEAERRLW